MSGSADDRFREMFYEEARELLISLEEGLMDLERRQSDRAHLDKTFRAAHSLKGAAAMVGLGSIAEFTHGIEAVLDRIRAGLLAVDSDIITTLLEARDHLAAMVEAEAARSPIPASGELTQRLVSLLRGPSPGGHADQASAAADVSELPPIASGVAAGGDTFDLAAAGLAGSTRRQPRGPNRRVERSPAPKTRKPRTQAPRSTQEDAEDGASSSPTSLADPHEADAGDDAAGAEDLPGDSDARPRRLAARDQPARRPRRAARPGRDVDRHRPGTGSAARPARPGTVLPDWTITLKTDADPERLAEAFLFFAEDSTAAIQRPAPTASGCRSGSAKPPRAGAAAVHRRQRSRSAAKPTAADDRGQRGGRRLRPRPTARRPLTRRPPAPTSAQVPSPRRRPRSDRSCRGCTPGFGSMPRSLTIWWGWPASWSWCPTI